MRDSGFYKALFPAPLLDVIRDVGILFLPKTRQQVCFEIISDRQLKVAKNALAKSHKLLKAAEGSSIYHFAAVPVKVLRNSLNLTESSFSEFEEHHKWNAMA